ncbi:MAG TPA: hypothetical protein EYG86_07870 [Crocinitomicaceae bacterium]|nr:hypothetical protein [Crocinitomicaceae bacterium]
MSISNFLKKNWQHFAVIAVFFILMFTFFSPEFDGYSLKQHDVEQFKGMSNEVAHHREKFDEEPLWTNAMFGGMPATQISVLYNGNIFQKIIIGFMNFIGVPAGIFLLHLLGFYILALCLKIKPIVGFIGAVAFAFATYEIVIIQAGHNSKATTVALMAPLLGAFIMTYRSNWKWGVLLSGLFMSFMLASNHLQVTYYLGVLLLGLGFYELFKAVKAKKIKHFAIVSGSLIAVYLLALFINYGNLTLTNDYAKHTIRGGNDISINPDGTTATKNTAGLDKDYITTWSYGVGESFTLLSPYVKGSQSIALGNSNFAEMVQNSDRSRKEIQEVLSAPYGVYWGEQPAVGGPTYVGIVMLIIMVLGLVFLEDKRKWVFFGVGILALMLSWGKNFMGLTEFFIDYIPGYNKFRTVTIIMVLIELIVPLIAVLFLDMLFKKREELKPKKKVFLITAGVLMIFLIGLKFVGLGDNYSSSKERDNIAQIEENVKKQLVALTPEQLAQNKIDLNNPQQIEAIVSGEIDRAETQLTAVKKVRQEIYHSSMNRSILFAIFTLIAIGLYFFTTIPTMVVVAGIAVLVLADLVPVGRNYLNADEDERTHKLKHWMPKEEVAYPISTMMADLQIMESEVKDPTILKAVENGEKLGKSKASELEFSGVAKRRVIESYKFSELNFATNYRVFTYNNPWGSSRASYFHKNLGGYHGAKLRNIQNLFEFQMANGNNKVFDILNVKYFIQGENMRPNPSVIGNVWFVKNIKEKESPNDEIRALGVEFKIENVSSGKLLVNDEEVKSATVFGQEKMKYLLSNNDTVDVQLSNGLSKGMEVFMVMDAHQKTNLVPAITLQMDTAQSFTKLVSITAMDDFSPRTEAVMLKSEAAKLTKKQYSGEGQAKMSLYKPNQIDFEIELADKQLAVFSEIYYPYGWKAFVDGKEQEILKVDYILRGLELEKGKHKVSFVYFVPKYKTASIMAVAGTIILLLLFGWMIFKEFKLKKEA